MSCSPSIVPDEDIYLVLDDFGPSLGRAWRETDEAGANRATLIRNLLDGQYEDPVRIVAFNTAEEKLAGMRTEFVKWKDLSLSTDGDYADSTLGGFLR